MQLEKEFVRQVQFKDLNVQREPMLYSLQTIKEAISVLLSSPYPKLPVADNNGKYVGMVGIRNILAKYDSVMPDSPISSICVYEPPIKDEALDEYFPGSCQCLRAVTGADDKLLGYISQKEVIDYAIERHLKIAETYSQVVASSYNGIIAINKEGNIIVFNPAAERILGIYANEYLGRHMSYLDPAKGLLDTLVTGQVSFGVKTNISGRTILTNRTPLIYKDAIVGAMGVFLDISELEKVTNELEQYKALARKLNAIIDSSYDGLYICDKDGIVTHVNPAWERICGFSKEAIIGKAAQQLVAGGLYNKSAAVKALETKKTCTVMLEMTSGPKKNQKIMATSTPVLDENNEIEQVVVNVRDITEIASLREQLDMTKQLSEQYATELEQIRKQQSALDGFIAQSPSMQRILDVVDRVSQVESTVLILGESGVGKEVIAKKIHSLSKRADKALIKINCGAIPESLLESELFGYDGGAFTGAKKEGKPGIFELASCGTLFLDEVGELPFNLQVKLLRAIQEREILRIGGIKPIPVDVRLITATNKELSEMVKKGLFREDLYYRLNVVSIKIPPLRNRIEDIPPLLYSILKKFNTKYGQDKVLSEPVVEKLLRYKWPGNIRELENLIERLVVLVNDDVVMPKHLPEFFKDSESNERVIQVNGIIPLKQAIEEVEAQLIETAIREQGTTRKAAKVLEVNQSTIVRKIKAYNLIKITDEEMHREEFWVHHTNI